MAFTSKPVLTVDIVDFSTMPSKDQLTIIKVLIWILNEAIPKQHNQPDKRIWSPAGDGGALTFWEDINTATETAIGIMKLLNLYNQGKVKVPNVNNPKVKFQVRIGLHNGPVSREIDFDDRENVWGNGMNICARVAGLAKPGQIVASEDFYREGELDSDQTCEVTNIGRWWTKHHKSLVLYNIYQDGAGIPGTQLQDWFEPFQSPLGTVIETYEAMLNDHIKQNKAFRAGVLAKRLLDLDTNSKLARQTLESIARPTTIRSPGTSAFGDDFFSHLSSRSVYYFFTKSRFQLYQAGERICQVDEEADSLMVIVAGEIEIYLRDGRQLDLRFKEGDIIGEMGLFNPVGKKRTATLKATKSTLALNLDYGLLSNELAANMPECEEILNHLWRFARGRTRQNEIHNHPLFSKLQNRERDTLAIKSELLPERYHEEIKLDVDVLLKHWLLVLEGGLTVTRENGDQIHFAKGECIGPEYLHERPSYSACQAGRNTYIIKLPQTLLKTYTDQNEEFLVACLLTGHKNKLKTPVG